MRRIVSVFAITLALIIAARGSLLAENQVSLSLGGGAAFPVRGIRTMFRAGYEGTGVLEFPLNENFSLLLRGGYVHWQFNPAKINTAIAALGGQTGVNVSGPFRAFPAMFGARLTFSGTLLRPYVGGSGGAYFLHWTATGTSPAAGESQSGTYGGTWTEPAMSLDAGVLLSIGSGVSLDIAGIYTAMSNADDRVEPADLFGVRIAGANTASYVCVHAGVRVEL
ncbi:MAG TPA: hypothetical protein VL221_04105 [Bacteroidota bacterium]|nr:hypothetical protein [Bacteroidota bacterium]